MSERPTTIRKALTDSGFDFTTGRIFARFEAWPKGREITKDPQWLDNSEADNGRSVYYGVDSWGLHVMAVVTLLGEPIGITCLKCKEGTLEEIEVKISNSSVAPQMQRMLDNARFWSFECRLDEREDATTVRVVGSPDIPMFYSASDEEQALKAFVGLLERGLEVQRKEEMMSVAALAHYMQLMKRR